MMAPLLVIVSFEPGSLQQKTFIGDLHNPQKPGQTGSSCYAWGSTGCRKSSGDLCVLARKIFRGSGKRRQPNSRRRALIGLRGLGRDTNLGVQAHSLAAELAPRAVKAKQQRTKFSRTRRRR
jgi:hypothetical protein